MRCDPAMMSHLGGARPREGMEAKVARDVADVAAGRAIIGMIIPDPPNSAVAVGTVTLWTHETETSTQSEIGWMVLPEYQGRGLAKRAVRLVLQRARSEGTWGVVHAYPATDNAPSNGICRSIGFTLVGVEEITFADQLFRSNHWSFDTAGTVEVEL